MRSKSIVLFLVLLTASAWGLFGQGEKTPASPAAKARPPVVRLDLLKPAEASLPPERRNIFTSGPASAGESEAEPAPLIPGGDEEGGQGAEVRGEAGSEPGGLQVQYIGFIVRSGSIVGLVLSGGTPLAVVKGDVLQPGYTVSALSRKAIEVTGPDGSKRAYDLQGVEE